MAWRFDQSKFSWVSGILNAVLLILLINSKGPADVKQPESVRHKALEPSKDDLDVVKLESGGESTSSESDMDFPTLENMEVPSNFCSMAASGSFVNKRDRGSQFDQDSLLYQNYFKGKKDGVYLDLGANDPVKLSNTLFFDQCLGWKGICMEPNPMYHSRWKSFDGKRSCEMLPNCIWKEKKTLKFKSSATSGTSVDVKATDRNTWDAECLTFQDVLDSRGITHIDFISMDLEGAELDLMQNFPFDKYTVGVWLVETFWLEDGVRDLDRIMMKHGYVKAAVLPVDSVYVRTSHKPLWLPPKEESHYYPENKKYLQGLMQRCFGGKTLSSCKLN